MKKEYIKNYENKLVNIGVPHLVLDHRLFYHTGKIIEITNEYLTLKKNDSIKQIRLEDVIEIKENRGKK